MSLQPSILLLQNEPRSFWQSTDWSVQSSLLPPLRNHLQVSSFSHDFTRAEQAHSPCGSSGYDSTIVIDRRDWNERFRGQLRTCTERHCQSSANMHGDLDVHCWWKRSEDQTSTTRTSEGQHTTGEQGLRANNDPPRERIAQHWSKSSISTIDSFSRWDKEETRTRTGVRHWSFWGELNRMKISSLIDTMNVSLAINIKWFKIFSVNCCVFKDAYQKWSYRALFHRVSCSLGSMLSVMNKYWNKRQTREKYPKQQWLSVTTN